MAVLAFAVAGAALAPAGYASVGWAIGSFIGNALFPPKLPDRTYTGPRLTDLNITATGYGQALPFLLGTAPTAGVLIWKTPRIEHVHTETTSSGGGGKGGGGGGQKTTTTTYTYTMHLAIALAAKGPIVGVTKIWTNGALKYNSSEGASTETVTASSGLAQSIRFYLGTSTQNPDPLIQSYEGAANTPAFRDTPYVLFEHLDLTPFGNNMPAFKFEVVSSGTTADLGVATLANLGVDGNIPTSGTLQARMTPAGDILYYGGANALRKYNVHAGGLVSTFSSPVYSAQAVGIASDGNWIVSGLSAAVGGVGTFQRVSSTGTSISTLNGSIPSNWGTSPAQVVDSGGNTLWGAGWSFSGNNNIRRVIWNQVSGATDTFTSDHITGADANYIFRNGAGIAGRVYVAKGNPASPPAIRYIETATLNVVTLNEGTQYALGNGLLVSRDGYLWLLTTTSPGNGLLEKRDASSFALIGSVAIPGIGTVNFNNSAHVMEDNVGNIWVIETGTANGGVSRAHIVHPTLLTRTAQSTSLLNSPFTSNAPAGFLADNRLILVSGDGSGNRYFRSIEPIGRIATTATTIKAAFDALAAEVNATSYVDTTAISGNIQGLSFSRVATCREMMEVLMGAYFIDAVESNNKVKFVPRGGASVRTIPEADLGVHERGSTPPPKIRFTRRQEADIPREVRVVHYSAATAYNNSVQYARRLSGNSRDILTIELPLVLTDTEAKQIAEKYLFSLATSVNMVEFSTTHKHAELEPTDVVTLYNGVVVRLETKEEFSNIIKFKGVTEESSDYTQVGVAVAPPAAVNDIAVLGATNLQMLDIPLLRDVDDGYSPYVAVEGYTSGWPGASVLKSVDGGITYTDTGVAFLLECVIGTAASALQNFQGGNIFDEQSYVDINVDNGALSSVTRNDVYNGANPILLGNELLHFRDANYIADRVCRISGFLRGRRGTEQYMSTHAIGDRFVLLDTSRIRRLNAPTSDIGVERLYKAVTLGTDEINNASIPYVHTAVALKPLSPIRLGGGRNHLNDVLGKFIRRTRVGGEWTNYVDAQIGEATEAYEVDIFTNSSYTTVKRTITSTTSAGGSVVTPSSRQFIYTSADQVTDFGSNQNPVYVRIYQISAVVGRGFPLQGQI